MAEEGFKRKLAAILSADVIGYSRLMRDDEEATVRNLAAHRVLITEIIQRHKGRVVDSPGDNILAEFASVVDAVNGAIKVQTEIKKSNTSVPEDRLMEFRIGINLGDVIEEEERIYGDGVNIAARVEGLADSGGVAISGTVYEHIKEKLSLGYHYLGEQDVKNISEPVKVYRLLTDPADAGKMIGEKRSKLKKLKWAVSGAVALIVLLVGIFAIWNYYFHPSFEPASEEKMVFPLPEKPSIAVLPFDNMSGDPEQEYFSDGITENIITALSKVRNIFVIARNSTFTYKGKPVKIQQVAEELGVQYVLEGSVQKTKDQVRITAQLIDALTGKHLWAERYDRELNDIFAIQDEIAKKVITALQVKLTEGEHARITEKGTKNLDAYLKLLQAWKHTQAINKEDLALARQFAKEALSIDSEYALAYSTLAAVNVLEVYIGASNSTEESLNRAEELAKKALTLDDTLIHAHSMLSLVYIFKRKYDKALTVAEQAVALGPNDDYAYFMLGTALMHSERFEEAIPNFKKSLRLRPHPLIQCLNNLATSYRFLGRYDEAIATYNKLLKLQPDHLPAHVNLAATYIFSGREVDARTEAEEVIKIDPQFSLDRYAKRIPYSKDLTDQLVEAWRKAGLPEHPPLKLPDKPSIAVLAFDNMSGDPKQEYFSDGITEEIITALSRIRHLFVIARTSSFKYKGKDVDIRMVGRELGVRYVLEGSVRIAEDKVRITAQLIDAETNSHIWAERFDRDMKDIFALQDEITVKIINALEVKLTAGEQARLWGKGTTNLNAYLKALEAREHHHNQTKEGNILARRLAEDAIALDPEYPTAYHLLALTHMQEVWLGTTKSPKQSLQRAVELAQKAIALDDSYAHAHGLLGFLYTTLRQHEKGIEQAEKAVALDPNGATVHYFLSYALRYAGRFEEAVQVTEKSIRLNPFPPVIFFRGACIDYIGAGRYEEAIAAAKNAVKIAPNDFLAHMMLATAYSVAGREEEAQAAAEEVLRINPKFSLEYFKKIFPFKNEEDLELLIGAMRKAGLSG